MLNRRKWNEAGFNPCSHITILSKNFTNPVVNHPSPLATGGMKLSAMMAMPSIKAKP